MSRLLGRLDELARTITRLRLTVIDQERAALELHEDEAVQQRATEAVLSTRAVLNAALLEHFDLSEELRRSTLARSHAPLAAPSVTS